MLTAVKVKPVFQLTAKKTHIRATPEEIQALRAEFDEKHCLCFPKFFHPSVLRDIQNQVLGDRQYYKKRHKGLALEQCMKENAASRLMHFYINDEKIFKFIETVTGTGPIGCFHGRVYRMIPGEGHFHKWHSDWTHNRILGVSINLSREVYSGGSLQIRSFPDLKTLHEVFNTGFGDMIVFRLGDKFEHRVTDVDGTASKNAFAGWFSTKPRYISCLKKASDAASKIKKRRK